MSTIEYVYLWEFTVNPQKKVKFEKLYGSEGEWEKHFKKHQGYISTQLLKSTEEADTYITIDRWKSKEDLEDFKSKYKSEFDVLEEKGEKLTFTEKHIGDFALVR